MSGKWDDLAPRVLSGVAMVAVGVAAVWAGGIWFHALIGICCGLMIWELVTMLDSNRDRSAWLLGGLSAAAVVIAVEIPPSFGLPLLLLPAMVGFGRMEQGAVTYAVYSALILLSGFGLMELRDDFGIMWMAWLLLVVVVTDIAGYFAGRLIGGPKLWPRVSPKKTWSGSTAGWIASGLIGLWFGLEAGFGVDVIGISVAVSMASQIGDMAESAVKRRAGVKDSSALIPGHGGLLDRFDGMLGAALLIVIAGPIIGFPYIIQ